ncbi:MAG: hypothetical protein EA388_13645, partial [Nitriliruptor sp.]
MSVARLSGRLTARREAVPQAMALLLRHEPTGHIMTAPPCPLRHAICTSERQLLLHTANQLLDRL